MNQTHALRVALTAGLLASAALGPSACDDRRNTGTTNSASQQSTAPSGTTGSGTSATNTPRGTTTGGTTGTPAADNTGRNDRDRNTANPTPPDQGGEADRRITAEIRRAVMAEPGVSINAQNCKIITAGGVVTLRGPVANQAERDMIEAKARAVAGVTRVVNELEVAGAAGGAPGGPAGGGPGSVPPAGPAPTGPGSGPGSGPGGPAPTTPPPGGPR